MRSGHRHLHDRHSLKQSMERRHVGRRLVFLGHGLLLLVSWCPAASRRGFRQWRGRASPLTFLQAGQSRPATLPLVRGG